MTHPQRVIDLAVAEVKLQYKGNSLSHNLQKAKEWDLISAMSWEETRQWYIAWSKAHYAWDYSLLEKRYKENTHLKCTHTNNWIDIYNPFFDTSSLSFLFSEPTKKMSKLQEIINKAFFTEKIATKTVSLIEEAKEVRERFCAVSIRARDAQLKLTELMRLVDNAFENQNKEKYIYYTKQLEAVLDFIEKDKEANTLSMLGGKQEKKVEEKYDPSV